MAQTHPTQDPVPIEYESPEGHKYSEVHGDRQKNLEVETKAEQEGDVQPNLYGTTPDPHNPELTDYEKELRGQVEEGTKAPEVEEQKREQGQKQADKPANKQAPTPPNK